MLRGQYITCTLWSEAVAQINDAFQDKSNHPLIIVLQLARAKIFHGEIRVSNTYNITKMLLNEDIPEVHDFKNSLRENSEVSKAISVSALSGSSISNIDDDLTSGHHTLVNTKSLHLKNKAGTYWIYGKIESVGLDGTWYYISCLRCTKKVSKVRDKFFCDKCNNSDATGSLRYKLIILIADEAGTQSLLLWNKECFELVGKTAMELKAHIANDNESPKMSSEITSLIGRAVLFKVQVRDGYKSPNTPLNVVTLNFDTDVVSKYCGTRSLIKETTEPDLLSLLASSDFVDERHGSSSNYSTPQIQSSGKLSDDNFENNSLKRNLDDEFSTTMNGKKNKIVVKVEK
ncbi:hypothetical protein C2S52_008110 [Perilla frutescens var. hirtella]|nr:hypothetical protein C2S52_008110 [Perilla frutescens var. hirtella]